MLDIKAWIKTTGIEVEEEAFMQPPPFPYIIFIADVDVGGSDDKNCIATREVSLELYSPKIDYISETKIENLLNEKSIKYKRGRTWIDGERCFQTVYDFNLVEKI